MSHKNYFACFGHGKIEEGVRGCEIIHDADNGESKPFPFSSLKTTPHHPALAT